MGKVLIAAFSDEENIDFDELILFLKEKGNIEIVNNVSIDNVLSYVGLEVDPKYRVVRRNGTEVELTNTTSSVRKIFSNATVLIMVFN